MTQTSAPVVLVTPQKPALIEGVAQKLAVLIRVQAPDAPTEIVAVRKPYHLALVIDRSGSMSGEPLAEAVRCAAHIVDRLQPTDVAVLVTFDDKVRVAVPAAPVGDRRALHTALGSIHAGGSTNLYGGWKAGADAIAPGAAQAALARVILLSDGNANVGELQSVEDIAAASAAAAANGVTTSTYGLGRDFNENLMVEMGKRGDGNHYYGETAADLFEPFGEEFDLISSLYARNLRLSLCARDGVVMKLRNDYPIDTRDVFESIRLPDLPFAAEAWAVVELEVPARLALEYGEQLLHVGVTGASPDGVPIAFHDVIFSMKAVTPPAWNVLLADPSVTARLAEMDAAALLQAARAAAANGEWKKIEQLLAEAQAKFADHPWLVSVLSELADLAQQQDSALFAKEALYGARRMSVRLSCRNEQPELSAEADAPSFVRAKPRRAARKAGSREVRASAPSSVCRHAGSRRRQARSGVKQPARARPAATTCRTYECGYAAPPCNARIAPAQAHALSHLRLMLPTLPAWSPRMAPDLDRMLTRHARSRMQQRGIAPDMLDCLLRYGSEQHDRHGGVIVTLDRDARRRLARARTATGVDVDRLRGLYAVLAGGCVRTVGHRYRRLRH